MTSPKLLGRPLAVLLILSMVLAAALPATALARDTSGDDVVVNTGPTLWQVKDAPAYVPVARDLGDTWRSVRMPPADQVEKILKDSGAIPLDASPEEIETAISQWSQKARKDAYIGPDPLAFRKLEAREKAVLNNDALPEDWELPTPPKSLMAVTVNFDGTDTITRPYPDPNNPVARVWTPSSPGVPWTLAMTRRPAPATTSSSSSDTSPSRNTRRPSSARAPMPATIPSCTRCLGW